MPGNFCREFSSEQNKDLILGPLPECDAKSQFAALMMLWRELRSIQKKTNPTEAEVDNYPNLVRRFHKLLNTKFSWFEPFPNQFHRLSHNFFFMTVDGNSLGTKSLEGLEKGNFTTQGMDAHHTYKGSRKKANKGVFKLLRLKSSRLLREYRRKPPARVQRCSRCHKIGHNAKNKACSAGIIIPDMEVGDAPNIEIFGEGAGLNDTTGTELVTSEEAGQSEDDSVVDIDDLLDGDDLF